MLEKVEGRVLKPNMMSILYNKVGSIAREKDYRLQLMIKFAFI